MANNVGITPGAGVNVASDELTFSGETAQVQYFKMMDGTEDSTNVMKVDPDGNAHFIEAGVRTSGVNKQLTLAFGTWTKASVGVGTLADRKSLLVFNDSDVRVRAAFSNVGTLADGMPIPSGQSLEFDGALDLYLQPESGAGKLVEIMEVA